MTPFQAVFGRPPPAVMHYEVDPKDPDPLKALLQLRDQLLSKLKGNLLKAQQYMKMKLQMFMILFLANYSYICRRE